MEDERPLDIEATPIQRALVLKADIYSEPESNEDRALLLLEQAKDAPNPALQRTMLTQVAGLLEDAASSEVSDPHTFADPAVAARKIGTTIYLTSSD